MYTGLAGAGTGAGADAGTIPVGAVVAAAAAAAATPAATTTTTTTTAAGRTFRGWNLTHDWSTAWHEANQSTDDEQRELAGGVSQDARDVKMTRLGAIGGGPGLGPGLGPRVSQ